VFHTIYFGIFHPCYLLLLFHSCIFHPCNFARIAFSIPAFSVAQADAADTGTIVVVATADRVPQRMLCFLTIDLPLLTKDWRAARLSVRRHSNVHLCTLNAVCPARCWCHWHSRFSSPYTASMLRLFRATRPAINRRQ